MTQQKNFLIQGRQYSVKQDQIVTAIIGSNAPEDALLMTGLIPQDTQFCLKWERLQKGESYLYLYNLGTTIMYWVETDNLFRPTTTTQRPITPGEKFLVPFGDTAKSFLTFQGFATYRETSEGHILPVTIRVKIYRQNLPFTIEYW